MSRVQYVLILLSSIIVGCSSTKSLKEGEVFYRGERIKFEKSTDHATWKINNSSEKFASVYWALWDAPNGALLGMPVTSFFPFSLYTYHLFYNEKSKGFNFWVRENFGEAPKTIQYVNPEIKLQKGISIFNEYGHFGTTGHYRLIYNKKKNKAYLRYFFDITEAYKYKSVTFDGIPNNAILDSAVTNFGRISTLQPSKEFNLYKIISEKSRLVKNLQDSGYYFISDKNIAIAADTSIDNKMLDLKISIDQDLPKVFYEPQHLNNVQIQIGAIIQPLKPVKYYAWEYGKIEKRVLDAIIDIKSQSRYSLSATKRTNLLLSELGIFSNPIIDYKVVSTDSTTLNPLINLSVLDATNIEFNIRGNYKNTGYIGPSIGFTFRQLNLFSGAENLTVNGDMYYDFPTGLNKERVSNSYGFSLRSTLSKPLLRPPFKFINHNYSLPKQFYKLNFEFNVRQDYFDLTAINATYGWSWKPKHRITHNVGLLDVTMSSIKNPTQKFKELVESNPLLAVTLVDQFLVGSHYEFNYRKQATTLKRWDINYTGRVEFSGNTINLFKSILSNTPSGERKFLGLEYNQFTRINSEFVANWHINKTHQLVFRNIMGIGFAYGNSEYMPYIKQYFTGGANSLRPFSARTIGPGRYLQLNEAEVNQVGDIKLEFNIEYRMPLMWKLNLGIFTDMGNVWLSKLDPERPGGEIRWNKVLQDTYVTSGLGLRLDLNYLVLRLDAGVVMRIPIVPEGSRWIWQYKTLIWAPVIGIGYPF